MKSETSIKNLTKDTKLIANLNYSDYFLQCGLKNGLIDEKNIYSIGKLITGEINLSDNNTRFFKSVGMALFDLFAADFFYKKAVIVGIGQNVEF